MLTRSRSFLAVICLLSYLPACTSWHEVGPTPAEFVSSGHPKRLRVQLADSTRLTMANPWVRADSLYGLQGSPGDTVGVPLNAVATTSVRGFSLGRTVGLGGLVVAGFVVGALLHCAASDEDFC